MRHAKATFSLVCLGLISAAVGCGPEGPYPSRPLTIICPWGRGGGTDNNCRVLGAQLKSVTGRSVNVVNRTGGSGVTGHRAGAKARPDGYTITMITVEINMMHWRGLADISWKDFRPVALINREASAIIVRKDAPWTTLAELTEAIRKEPGKYRASGTAMGGIWHLALTGWLTSIGLPADAVVWIPSKGAAPSLVELLGGGVDMVTCSLPEARTQIAEGQARALAIMADQRSQFFPDVPTFKESGVEWALAGWRAVALPKQTPDEVAVSLEGLLQKVVEGPEYGKIMANIGADVRFVSGADLVQFLAEQDLRLGKLLQECGLAE